MKPEYQTVEYFKDLFLRNITSAEKTRNTKLDLLPYAVIGAMESVLSEYSQPPEKTLEAARNLMRAYWEIDVFLNDQEHRTNEQSEENERS